METHTLSRLEGDLILRGLDLLIPSLKLDSKAEVTATILAEHLRIGRESPKVGFKLTRRQNK
jgi:hypothetical protein